MSARSRRRSCNDGRKTRPKFPTKESTESLIQHAGTSPVIAGQQRMMGEFELLNYTKQQSETRSTLTNDEVPLESPDYGWGAFVEFTVPHWRWQDDSGTVCASVSQEDSSTYASESSAVGLTRTCSIPDSGYATFEESVGCSPQSRSWDSISRGGTVSTRPPSIAAEETEDAGNFSLQSCSDERARSKAMSASAVPDSKTIKCPLCGKVYKDEMVFQRHCQWNHRQSKDDDDRSLQCVVCLKNFKALDTLTRHRAVCTDWAGEEADCKGPSVAKTKGGRGFSTAHAAQLKARRPAPKVPLGMPKPTAIFSRESSPALLQNGDGEQAFESTYNTVSCDLLSRTQSLGRAMKSSAPFSYGQISMSAGGHDEKPTERTREANDTTTRGHRENSRAQSDAHRSSEDEPRMSGDGAGEDSDDSDSSLSLISDDEVESDPSEGSPTSTETSTPASNRSLHYVFSPMQQRLIDRFMEEVRSLFEQDPAYVTCVGAGSPETAYVGSSNALAVSSAASRSRNLKRTQRDHDSPSPSDRDDDQGRKRRKGPGSKKGKSAVDRRFACPFMKHDPATYEATGACNNPPGFSTVHRVKEHIYRNHMVPLHCLRCGHVFVGTEARNEHAEHLRRQPSCTVQDFTQIPGCTEQQRELIRDRRRRENVNTEEEKWTSVYLILFPDAVNVPSPYFDGLRNLPRADLAEFHDLYRRRLFPAIRQEMERRVDTFGGSLLRDMVEIVRQAQDGIALDFLRSDPHSESPTTSIAPTAPPSATAAAPQLLTATEQDSLTNLRQLYVPAAPVEEPYLQPVRRGPSASRRPSMQGFMMDSGYGSNSNQIGQGSNAYSANTPIESRTYEEGQHGLGQIDYPGSHGATSLDYNMNAWQNDLSYGDMYGQTTGTDPNGWFHSYVAPLRTLQPETEQDDTAATRRDTQLRRGSSRR